MAKGTTRGAKVAKAVSKGYKVISPHKVVATGSNFANVFYKYFPGVSKSRTAVHHRIPQKYRKMFGEEVVDRLSNLRGVDRRIHETKITPEWNKFMRKYPNATPTQVKSFARYIDKKYGKYFIAP